MTTDEINQSMNAAVARLRSTSNVWADRSDPRSHIIRDEPSTTCSGTSHFGLCAMCRDRIIIGDYLDDRIISVGDHYRAFTRSARDYVQNFRAWYTDSVSY